MKWRNQMVALFCLVAFVGLGVLYFQHWVVQKPFAVILFVGEGLAPHEFDAARLYVGGADARFSIDSMPHLALLLNASRDFAVPDQAAATTALATGTKVNNRSLGKDPSGKDLPGLIDLARQSGRAAGLVSDCDLTSAVPVAFYGHGYSTDEKTDLVRQLADRQDIDIVLGGGAGAFLPGTKGGRRNDNRDLLLEMRSNGVEVVRTRAELESAPGWRHSRILGVFANDDLAFEDQIEQRRDQPTLSDMVRRAIQMLQYNRRGYFLVVDAGLMGRAASQNNAERCMRHLAELDRAVATARRYAGPHSTIVVCGDVAVGGMLLNGYPFHSDSGIALLGLNSSGEPWLTWATGPKGTRFYGAARVGETKPSPTPEPAADADNTEPGAYYLKAAATNAEDVLAFGIGPGTEQLSGVCDSTVVFKVLRNTF